MKPLYNSATGATKRPRIRKRNVGEIPAHLRNEVKKYGVDKIALGMTLIGLGIDVLNLNLR